MVAPPEPQTSGEVMRSIASRWLMLGVRVKRQRAESQPRTGLVALPQISEP